MSPAARNTEDANMPPPNVEWGAAMDELREVACGIAYPHLPAPRSRLRRPPR